MCRTPRAPVQHDSYRGVSLGRPPLLPSMKKQVSDRSYEKELDWYNSQLEVSPSVEDTQRLTKDRENLLKQLTQALAA